MNGIVLHVRLIEEYSEASRAKAAVLEGRPNALELCGHVIGIRGSCRSQSHASPHKVLVAWVYRSHQEASAIPRSCFGGGEHIRSAHRHRIGSVDAIEAIASDSGGPVCVTRRILSVKALREENLRVGRRGQGGLVERLRPSESTVSAVALC